MAEVEAQADSGRSVELAVSVVSVAMVLYHLLNTQVFILGGKEHMNAHLGFSLILIYLGSLKGRWGAMKISGLVLMIVTLGVILYVGYFYDELEMRAGFNTKLDMVVGTLLIIVVLEGARRAFGKILSVFAILFMAYFFLGPYCPPPFKTAIYEPGRILTTLSIELTGIYGVALNVSASYIFLFVVFGSLLQVSGATGFFIELGRLAGRRIRSGPAVSAVVTSALMGTTTGSIGANIVTTGSFTIPLMKRAGYKPEQAAAIESAASNGGQIMPPVMGAAAFAMAAVTGISYLNIIIAAVLPAILYFGIAGLYTFLQASKMKLSPVVEEVNKREMLLRAPLFITPVGLIVYLLTLGKPLMYCAFWAIVVTVALSLPRKETRPSLKAWVRGIVDGARVGASIGAATACLGLIMETMTGTGLGLKLPALVEMWSGGHYLLALLMTAGASLILGMEVSTLGVYLLVATVTAPILIKMGVALLQAHFFVFFYAVFAMVTPPIGMGPILASKISNARYLPTAMESVKVSCAGFVLPFLIIWNPELLMQSSGLPLPIVMLRLLACAVLLTAMEVVLVGYYITGLSLWERILILVCGVGIVLYFITANYGFLIAGFFLFFAITLVQLGRNGYLKKILANSNRPV